MKRAFTLLESLIVISILIFIGSFYIKKIDENNLEYAVNRISLYLKQTRYQALIENKEKHDDGFWHKTRWTLKFFRCNKNIQGFYYNIYSDRNKTGHPGLEESLEDPLTNKKIYSTNKCEYKKNSSKYVLLTKEFGINEIEVSCNNTNSLGQISFGNDGRVYSKLSPYANEHYEYEITSKCIIKLKDEKENIAELIIEPKTAYVYRKQ